MLEDNELNDQKLEELKKVLYDENLAAEIAEFNFELGKKYFSFDTLEEKLSELIHMVTK